MKWIVGRGRRENPGLRVDKNDRYNRRLYNDTLIHVMEMLNILCTYAISSMPSYFDMCSSLLFSSCSRFLSFNLGFFDSLFSYNFPTHELHNPPKLNPASSPNYPALPFSHPKIYPDNLRDCICCIQIKDDELCMHQCVRNNV